jgi:DNA invertase Pin-like site-specific DNA recombinase
MTSYGYARVSTRDQDPQLQINALAAAGCAPIVKEHASGVAKKRPVLDQLLGQLRPGDQLVVWKLDRLGRSITFLHRTIEDLTERGIAFRSITDPIDTSTPQGQLQLGILAAFSAFERSLIRERTLAGKARMKAEGRHTGGPALFGWEPDHITVNEHEAALVREVAERVLDGEPLGRIVDEINARDDYPPPRRGGRWRVTSMRRVLENPTTAAIIDDQEHEDLRRLFLPKVQRQHQGRPAGNLLSGILSCPCGQVLYAATKTGKSGVPQRVYRCHRGQGSGGRYDGCGRTQVAQGRADDYALELFVSSIVGPDFGDALDQRQAELLDNTTAEELDEWRAELGELEQVMPTRFGTEDMKRRHADLRRMVDQATSRLMAQPDLQAFADLPRSEDQLRERWSSWSLEARRVWIRRLVERIVVNPVEVRRGPATDVESRMSPVFKL